MSLRNINLDAEFTLPYSSQLYLGRGVKVLEGKAAYKSPFQRRSIKLQPLSQVSASASFKFEFVQTKKELEKMVDLTVDASANLSGIPVSGNTKYLSKLEVSDTKMATLLECKFEPDVQRLAVDPKFTQEAKDLLDRSPDEFARIYGDYYVCGFTCRSSLMAVAEHSAHKKEDLDKFSAHVRAGIAANEGVEEKANYEPLEDKPEAEGELADADEETTADKKPVKGNDSSSTESNQSTASKLLKVENPVKASVAVGVSISNKTKDDNVSTSISIFKTGVKGIGSVAQSLDDVLNLYQDFSEYVAPVPVIVHLAHYRSIDARCVSPGENLLMGVSKPLSRAMKSLYRLYNEVLGSEYPEVRGRKEHLNTLLDRLADLDPLDSSFSNAFGNWETDVNNKQIEISRMKRRRVFVQKVKAFDDNDWGKSKLYQFQEKGAAGENVDRFGITHNTQGLFQGEDEFIRGEINVQDSHYKASSGWGTQGSELAINRDGMRFVGFEVHDHWKDGSNGGYELRNINPDHEIRIRVQSKPFQGCDWSLRAFRVSPHLYIFD